MAQGGDSGGSSAIFSGGLVRRTIEERALYTPDATAVFDRDGRAFSWHEINARANRLADLLCEKGVGNGVAVGLAGPAGAATIVGWLAALKADAPVVPLGEACDSESQRIIEVAAPRLIMRSAELATPAEIPALSIDLGGSVPATPNLRAHGQLSKAALLNAGSSGLMTVTLRDLDAFSHWQTRALHPAGAVRVCTLSPSTTLASVREIAATLGAGATLCFPTTKTAEASPALWGFMREAGISRLYVPGDQVDALAALSIDLHESLDRLRDLIIVGSLNLSPRVMAFLAHHPHSRVHMLHHAHDSASVGACTLELPFAEWTKQGRVASNAARSATVLHKFGGFVARLPAPAVA